MSTEYTSDDLGLAIDRYVGEKRPSQAIYLQGEWGIGKTHFIKSREAGWHDRTVIYVSLFGLSSVSEVEDAIVAKQLAIGNVFLNEGLAKVIGAGIEYVGSEKIEKAPGLLGTAVSSLAKWVKKGAVDALGVNSVIILDDLERYVGDPTDILSLCNRLTEHQGTHVILIGSDKDLIRNEKYDNYFEKSVKNIFSLNRTSVDIARIVTGLFKDDEKFYEFLSESVEKEIVGVINSLDCKNIRILASAVSNIETIYREYSESFQKHKDKAARLAKECLLITVAFKSLLSQAKAELGRYLTNTYMFRGIEVPQEKKELREKFQLFISIGFPDNKVSHPSLWALVADGIFSRDEIRREISLWEPKDLPLNEKMQLIYDDQYEMVDETIDLALRAIEDRSMKFPTLMSLIDIYARFLSVQEIEGLNRTKTAVERIVVSHAKYVSDNFSNVVEEQSYYFSGERDILIMYVSRHSSCALLTKIIDRLINAGRVIKTKELADRVNALLVNEPLKAFAIIDEELVRVSIFQLLDVERIGELVVRGEMPVSAAFYRMLEKRYSHFMTKAETQVEIAAFRAIVKLIKPQLKGKDMKTFQRKRILKFFEEKIAEFSPQKKAATAD